MRALIQRVREATVTADGGICGHIGQGLLVFLGIGGADDEETARRLWGKLSRLRIFADDADKTNLSVRDVGGNVLVVSQFTLYADCRRGNRPSFTDAAAPARANELYEFFCQLIRDDLGTVETGAFGAHMDVSLLNDGPFTIWLDTDTL